MATERATPTAPGRRRLLAAGLALALPPARAARRTQIVAAWDADDGEHRLGLLDLSGTTVRVLASVALPTRAHGLVRAPDGTVLAAARRPGEWLLRWSPRDGAVDRVWLDPDRRLTGHLLPSADGRVLYTVETELETGQGRISVRDPRHFARLGDLPTHGIDPHQLLVDADGSLLVANGGVPTAPETGRARLDLERMDASLVRLDARDGRLLGQWRLDDRRLSLRHLARAGDGTVGVALQAEHDEAAVRASAPLLALFDGRGLRLADQAQALAGYGGDIAAAEGGFVVSAPRAGGLARWSGDGRWAGFDPLPEACALAADAAGLAALGRGAAQRGLGAAAEPLRAGTQRFDNHALVWR